jgi:hypothetical protein
MKGLQLEPFFIGIIHSMQLTMKPSMLLEKPENWCKIEPAMDSKGVYINPAAPAAVRFCIVGALYRTNTMGHRNEISETIKQRWPERSEDGDIALFNDHPQTTHGDVIQLLKEVGL